MRVVQKLPEPRQLAETRSATTTDLRSPLGARSAFDQLDKAALREQLVREQGWLCAFCMRRVDPEQRDERGEFVMKIAHRVPLKSEPGAALTWANLLGSCDGGQRAGLGHYTCDLRQGDTPLTVDPTDGNSIARVTMRRRDGRAGLFVGSDDPTLERELDKVLNLNAGYLPELREAMWMAFRTHVMNEHPSRHWEPEVRRRAFARWRFEKGERLKQFCGVVEHKLKRHQAKT